MENLISLYGNKQHLIDVLESHIAYLHASGYDDGEHEELDYCYKFLIQLDENSIFLPDKEHI